MFRLQIKLFSEKSSKQQAKKSKNWEIVMREKHFDKAIENEDGCQLGFKQNILWTYPSFLLGIEVEKSKPFFQEKTFNQKL